MPGGGGTMTSTPSVEKMILNFILWNIYFLKKQYILAFRPQNQYLEQHKLTKA